MDRSRNCGDRTRSSGERKRTEAIAGSEEDAAKSRKQEKKVCRGKERNGELYAAGSSRRNAVLGSRSTRGD